jgi:hypothetical protein
MEDVRRKKEDGRGKILEVRDGSFSLLFLSGQRELQRDSEIVSRSGIAAGRKQGLVRLTLVVSRERHEARQRVIGHKRHLKR